MPRENVEISSVLRRLSPSRENVEISEIVRWLYALPPDRLREVLLPSLHPDFEIVPSRDFPDQRVLRGIAGLEEWASTWRDLTDDFEITVQSTWAHHEHLVVAVEVTGRATRSGLPVDDHHAAVWTIRDGLIVMVRHFRPLREALDAAGLLEQDAHADS